MLTLIAFIALDSLTESATNCCTNQFKCDANPMHCANDRIECDARDGDCRVQCEQSLTNPTGNSCATNDAGCCGATIICPDNLECRVTCGFNCNHLTVMATTSTNLLISGCNNGRCNDMTIFCPKRLGYTCAIMQETNAAEIRNLNIHTFNAFNSITINGQISNGNIDCYYPLNTFNNQCQIDVADDSTLSCKNSHSLICLSPRPTRAPIAPTNMPTNKPSTSPIIPTNRPTKTPTNIPTNIPTISPTLSTHTPTNTPSNIPTTTPTLSTNTPTNTPINIPTTAPTNIPTETPTNIPTNVPSNTPTNIPTTAPSNIPTNTPTYRPSQSPTKFPSISPSVNPTISPTPRPTTHKPSIMAPSTDPTESPTNDPTISPTISPTTSTLQPTTTPSESPSLSPTTFKPTMEILPTRHPSISPSVSPTTFRPTMELRQTIRGLVSATMKPTQNPTIIIQRNENIHNDTIGASQFNDYGKSTTVMIVIVTLAIITDIIACICCFVLIRKCFVKYTKYKTNIRRAKSVSFSNTIGIELQDHHTTDGETTKSKTSISNDSNTSNTSSDSNETKHGTVQMLNIERVFSQSYNSDEENDQITNNTSQNDIIIPNNIILPIDPQKIRLIDIINEN